MQPDAKTARLILALSLTAVALYACVLPPWEGWDEPFHYGRVEGIAVHHELGTLGKSTLTAEVADSLLLVPLSRLLAPLVPGSVSFEQWHQLPSTQRTDLRSRLLRLSPLTRQDLSSRLNYEAQQAPLAYLVLAPFDLLLGRIQLVPRILILRLIEALTSILLIYFALLQLARALDISSAWQVPLLMCALSVQTLWASIAHIGNDGFAIPLAIWLLALLAADASVLPLAIVLGLGLATKAYFLSFIPVFAMLIVLRVRTGQLSRTRAPLACLIPIVIAAPWYARNIVLYGSFSGTQESVAGVTFSSAIQAVPHIKWVKSVTKLSRDSLWSGNWSFIGFSRTTLLAEEGLLFIGFILVAANYRSIRNREIWLWIACACFAAGLFYQTCVTWRASGGLSISPEPWYGQGILLCGWALLFRGYQAYPKIGRLVSFLLCLLAGWIGIATFIAKLLPWYGGGVERGTISAVIGWWRAHPTQEIAAVTPAPVYLIYALLALYSGLLIVVLVRIAQSAIRRAAPGIREA